jgi:hypothetical protein
VANPRIKINEPRQKHVKVGKPKNLNIKITSPKIVKNEIIFDGSNADASDIDGGTF